MHPLHMYDPAVWLELQIFTGEVESTAFTVRPFVTNLAVSLAKTLGVLSFTPLTMLQACAQAIDFKVGHHFGEGQASELASASQKLGPNFLISYFRGLALDRAGKPLEAMVAFQEAAQLNSRNAEVHLAMGKTELGLGRVSDAITELQEALRLNPADQQAKRLLSKAYNRAGDAKSAEAFAEASTTDAVKLEGDLLRRLLRSEVANAD
jgi:tetratricopeptide (TPR) repeat protein